jgi:hypothetical protein
MIDLDTPEDLELVLLENASPKKSISYLWQIKKNHFRSSFSPASIKPKRNARTNLDIRDGGASTLAKDV